MGKSGGRRRGHKKKSTMFISATLSYCSFQLAMWPSSMQLQGREKKENDNHKRILDT